MGLFARLLAPLLEKLGKHLLAMGLNYIETKFPKSKAIIEMVIGFLEDAKAEGDDSLADSLHEHVASFRG